MNSDEIIKLMGYGLAMIVAAVIVLFGFFRGMRWLETRANKSPASSGRTKRKRKPKDRTEQPVTQAHYPGVTSRPLAQRLVLNRDNSESARPVDQTTKWIENDSEQFETTQASNLGTFQSSDKVQLSKVEPDVDRVDIRLVSGEVFEAVTMIDTESAPSEIVSALSADLRRDSIAFMSRDGKTFVIQACHVRWIVGTRTNTKYPDTKPANMEMPRGTVG